jgi:hypothetical protein
MHRNMTPRASERTPHSRSVLQNARVISKSTSPCHGRDCYHCRNTTKLAL